MSTASANVVSSPGRNHEEVTVKSSRASIMLTMPMATVRSTDQSVSRPASGVPTTMPSPKASR